MDLWGFEGSFSGIFGTMKRAAVVAVIVVVVAVGGWWVVVAVISSRGVQRGICSFGGLMRKVVLRRVFT